MSLGCAEHCHERPPPLPVTKKKTDRWRLFKIYFLKFDVQSTKAFLKDTLGRASWLEKSAGRTPSPSGVWGPWGGVLLAAGLDVMGTQKNRHKNPNPAGLDLPRF